MRCEVWEGSRRGGAAYRPGQATGAIDGAEVPWVARVKARAPQTGHRDGSWRLAQPLQAAGEAVGRSTARRLRPQAGVSVRRRHRCPVSTASRHGEAVAPQLVARQCAGAPPDTVGVGASTDVWTADGGAELAVWLDWHARPVVGWARPSRIAAALVQDAWPMALGRRRPAAGLRQHAERGRQEACHADHTLLAEPGSRGRMSRTGECLDHAVAERCFGSVKGECTALRHYVPRQEAREDMVEDIERFYTSKRLPADLGYVSPHDCERLGRVA